MFQMHKLRLRAKRWFSQSQPGVGRLGLDPGLSLVGGARSQHLILLNLLGVGTQEGHLSASSRDLGLTRRPPVRGLGPWFTQASYPIPCLALELNLGRAQSLTPWSICPACKGPAPETQALPLIVVSATWDVVCGTGAQGHAKHISVPPWSYWSFRWTFLGLGLHWVWPGIRYPGGRR